MTGDVNIAGVLSCVGPSTAVALTGGFSYSRTVAHGYDWGRRARRPEAVEGVSSTAGMCMMRRLHGRPELVRD